MGRRRYQQHHTFLGKEEEETHTMTVLAHGVCVLTACLYQQHPPKTTADHLRDPVVAEVERDTKEKADRRKGVYRNCNNTVKKKVCQLC